MDDFVYALDATTGKLAWENRIVDYREDSAQESLVVDTRVRMPTEMEMLSFETSAIAMLVTAPIEGTAVNQFMRAIKGHQEPAGSRWCLSRSLLIRPPGMRCVKVVLWKTFDIFTQGESDIDEAYAKGDYTYPFWSHPIPKFISNQGGITPGDYSYVATLELGKYFFDPKGSVGRYTGKDGPQQSAEEVIWSLPNGLQG